MPDTELDRATAIVRMAETEGFMILKEWIDNRISILTNKILAGESDIRVDSIVKSKKGTKLDITVLNISKDADRQEIKTWKLLLDKIASSNKIIFQKG